MNEKTMDWISWFSARCSRRRFRESTNVPDQKKITEDSGIIAASMETVVHLLCVLYCVASMSSVRLRTLL